jgi:MerR family transcriptional regulator, light-induced transcriptional regulator
VADEALTAGAVARRLGVAVTTLRTWHQRYGLGPSHHVPGQHRRYTPEDMDRLQVMRRLTAQGVTPAEAAAWARRAPVPMDVSTPAAGPESVRPDVVWQSPDNPVFLARDGGGHAIPLGRAGPAARGLARAALRLDAPAQRDILEMIISNLGVVDAWDQVIMPVLVGIGERYEATRRFIEVEHLMSRGVTEVLGSVPRPSSDQMPRVLLAAADEEQHTLPLEALAAALAEAGVPSRLLGARVPPEALSDAVARTGPAAVVVWAQTGHTGDPEQLRRVSTGPHRPLLVAAAGPGWPHHGLPAGVPLLGSLGEAVQLLVAAAADSRQAG